MSATAASINTGTFTNEMQTSQEAERVRQALVGLGLETPVIDTGLTRDEKYDRIRASMTDVVNTLGLDLSDDSLCETPHRIAKMYVDELFSGLDTQISQRYLSSTTRCKSRK